MNGGAGVFQRMIVRVSGEPGRTYSRLTGLIERAR